ncbi:MULTISPECIES: ferritin-like domain-containing protein [unclassified Haematospirillum]|uniref:ferritin-like domain-containing protein n=1 Tax=unclassified Haematospirillum TaxID=2622088 RepID=UPI0014393183|nr:MULTISPECIES: ferritin-like domain-containing protein [unclassified Haematospirillum]NKD54727.1 ferritin-like domain-containing protein [Haematospirillum sp. H4890]NKD74565.1 ferritin-like domain-containing protein [Haematospirillum sp. H4485]NKD87551.1 ferritin-like domain-containing protein [Haematospirillum sp. 15-248]
MFATISDAAHAVLTTEDPARKCLLTRRLFLLWERTGLPPAGQTLPPDRPARPEHPALLPPRDMPKRSTGPGKGRISLIHALAHIELNAVDLAWDIVARFNDERMPVAFYKDWIRVADDEAGHFMMLEGALRRHDSFYGALPAHDGLWQAAEKTTGSLSARLALVPMTLEARGLDTTPATEDRLRAQGEHDLADMLHVIFEDEIRHVHSGVRWLTYLAQRDNQDPAALFATHIQTLYPGGLKPPFNVEARTQAGFPESWYRPLQAEPTPREAQHPVTTAVD